MLEGAIHLYNYVNIEANEAPSDMSLTITVKVPHLIQLTVNMAVFIYSTIPGISPEAS